MNESWMKTKDISISVRREWGGVRVVGVRVVGGEGGGG